SNARYTLRILYPEWLNMKFSHSASSSYVRRIQNDWNKYYEDDSIVDILIEDLTYLKLDKWAHDKVKQGMTKKQYYNMSLIVRQCIEYAMEDELKIIDKDPFSRVKIDGKLVVKNKKPSSESQVFLCDEQRKICEHLADKISRNEKAITPYALLLNFQLGLRVGEIVAIKWNDIENGYISINRMEVDDYSLGDGIKYNGKKVVEFTKSSAGVRNIYINNEAKKTLNMLKKRAMEYDYYDNDYIMVGSNGNRMTTASVNKYLFTVCRELNIPIKSSHKIRKTFISSLFDNGSNINKIREIAGHEDERTSLNNYCFDRRSDEETEKVLNNIGSNSNMVAFKAG
ncbi:MAG: site-specific integrase, partial [Lachnospiraceae bacterium]